MATTRTLGHKLERKAGYAVEITVRFYSLTSKGLPSKTQCKTVYFVTADTQREAFNLAKEEVEKQEEFPGTISATYANHAVSVTRPL